MPAAVAVGIHGFQIGREARAVRAGVGVLERSRVEGVKGRGQRAGIRAERLPSDAVGGDAVAIIGGRPVESERGGGVAHHVAGRERLAAVRKG